MDLNRKRVLKRRTRSKTTNLINRSGFRVVKWVVKKKLNEITTYEFFVSLCCIGSAWQKLLFRFLLLLFGRVLFVSFSVGEGLCIAQQRCCFCSFPCTVHVCCLSLCYFGISVSSIFFFCNGLPNCTAWCCCFCVCCK